MQLDMRGSRYSRKNLAGEIGCLPHKSTPDMLIWETLGVTHSLFDRHAIRDFQRPDDPWAI